MTHQQKIEALLPDDQPIVFYADMDEALIGVDYHVWRAIYSVTQMIECLMGWGMTNEEAIVYFEQNIAGTHTNGPTEPILCYDGTMYM